MFTGRSCGLSHTRATSRYPATAVGQDDKLADDWERERKKHQMTLNGTRLTSAATSQQEPATQHWSCIDNTSCEIQLSLVQQQQKLLNDKRQMSAKLHSSSHHDLFIGHSDARMHSVLSSLDNKHLDAKCVSSDTSVRSKTQPEFLLDDEICRGIRSRGAWSRSVDYFNHDVSRSGRAHVNGPDIPDMSSAVPDKRYVREHEFEAKDEPTRKKSKHLQHVRGSQKSGKKFLNCGNLLVPCSSVE